MEERFLPYVRHDVAVLSSPYELVKTVLMTLLLPARVLATIVCLALYSGVCRVASWGLREQDMAQVYKKGWRATLLRVAGQPLCRLSWLLSLGCWVRVRGDTSVFNDKKEKAQIIVS
jgi:hypothetical protein